MKLQEISGHIIRKLLMQAEAWANERIEKAVITVPAYFDEEQRKATETAGLIAGIYIHMCVCVCVCARARSF